MATTLVITIILLRTTYIAGYLCIKIDDRRAVASMSFKVQYTGSTVHIVRRINSTANTIPHDTYSR